jgi:TPR repeat protein
MAIISLKKVAAQVRYSARCAVMLLAVIAFCAEIKAAEEESIENLKIHAERGHANSQVILGGSYAKGEGVVKNEVEAAKLYRKAAAQGHAGAQALLAICYFDGVGVAKNEIEAIKWALKAAEQGDEGAPMLLSIFYDQGKGEAKNPIEAVKWGRKAAERGDDMAQCFLGACYELGIGVEKNANEAVKWYLKSANQGYAKSQLQLGLAYIKGSGVVKNDVEAYKWWALASSSESEEFSKKAQSNLRILEQKLSRAEISRGQELARGFTAKNSEVRETSKNSTNVDPRSTGTGFFITSKGHLITNFHVIKEAQSIKIVTKNGLLPAEVIKKDESNDLALLKVDSDIEPTALAVTSSRNVKLGDSVATIGFPNIDIQGFAPKYSKGEIASLSGAADDSRCFQISVPVQPGNSGGALFDEFGNVIGIVSSKLSASAAIKSSGLLPENVNYAVKSSFLLGFLESIPKVNEQLQKPAVSIREAKDILDTAQNASVLVIVY